MKIFSAEPRAILITSNAQADRGRSLAVVRPLLAAEFTKVRILQAPATNH